MGMRVHIMDPVDTSFLDAVLLGPEEDLQAMPSRFFEQLEPEIYMQWANKHGIYQLLTHELVIWLQDKIQGRSCLEICAGRGGMGHTLGVRATDSYMHQVPEIRAHYLAMGQVPTDPPSYVEKIDANEAVKKYQPEVVLAAFCTQRWREGEEDGNVFGPLEEEWLDAGRSYIHVGVLTSHRTKRILARPHEVFAQPWLYSRAGGPENGRIWVWEPGMKGKAKSTAASKPRQKRRGKEIKGL